MEIFGKQLVIRGGAVYLDHNATTPALPEVVDAMLPFLRETFENPSSTHGMGGVVRRAVERAREQVASLVGSEPEEIVFTSGGTESNNLAIRGATESARVRGCLVTSLIEHPSVAGPCAWLERHGWEIRRVAVDRNGRLNVDEMVRAIDSQTVLVTVMHANGETGVLQPLEAVSPAAAAAGAVFHTDASQSLGKVPVDVGALGVDLLSIAAHKVYGPKGVGALYVRRGTRLAPLLAGGGQERGIRPGTENVASIVGMGVACERAGRDLAAETTRVRVLRERLWERLREHIPGVALNGHPQERLPNTLSVRVPAISGVALLAATPEVAASTGAACHAGTQGPPNAVVLMGIPADEALGTIRLTLGRGTTAGDVDHAAAALGASWRRLAPHVQTPPVVLPGAIDVPRAPARS